MLQLPDDIREAFKQGEFTIRQSLMSFNGIWSDMAVEKTVIRDSKSSSGVIGLTRKLPALTRWTLTRHYAGEYTEAMRQRSGLVDDDNNEYVHDQSKPHSMKQDEKHVQQILAHITNNMTNPFDIDSHPPDTLVNIATGLHASTKVQESLLSAVEKGRKQCETFVNSSLSEGKIKTFITSKNITI